MTVSDVMAELQTYGSESIKKILLKHGVKEPFFGVKIDDLKKIQKKIKTNQQMALKLYDTGNADAMYLAGLIADDKLFTKSELQAWVEQATSNTINEYTVPWVTAGSNFTSELALTWIESAEPHIAAAGWSTLSCFVALTPDEELDLNILKGLLTRVAQTIHQSPNRVRQKMNGFVIAVGSYVLPLVDEALQTARVMGAVTVDMNGTACKVPDATEYIMKVKNAGKQGKKKKTVKC